MKKYTIEELFGELRERLIALEREREAAFDLLRKWEHGRTSVGGGFPVKETNALLASQPADKPAPEPAWVPKVGKECEWLAQQPDDWKRVTITSIYEDCDGDVWYRHSGQPFGFALERFRPLPKPEREPWIGTTYVAPDTTDLIGKIVLAVQQNQRRTAALEATIDQLRDARP